MSLLLNFDFLRSYKPVSRILFPSVNSGRYHLSVPIITHRDQSAYPPTRLSASNEQFSRVGLCGISACKVYPPDMLPYQGVGSYPTFSTSPLPFCLSAERGAVIFCGTICSRRVGTRLLTGAMLCAVRTFLPYALGWGDSLACSSEGVLRTKILQRANCKNNHGLPD